MLPTVAEWWPIRRAVAGGILGATLMEHALDAELPAEALADDRVQRIIELAGMQGWLRAVLCGVTASITGELMMLGNDLTSLPGNLHENRIVANHVMLIKCV